jgi:predicted DNA-binding transcriptional regulator AlpA
LPDLKLTVARRRGVFRSKRKSAPTEREQFSMSRLEGLPAELARHRILDTAETLEFVKLSPAEWRKLRAAGKAPRPVMLGTRKQGYKIGDLIDWIASRMQPAA